MTCPHAAGSAVDVDATIRGVEHVEIDVHVDARQQHRLDRLQRGPGARERLGRHVRDPRLAQARALVLVEVAGAREHDRLLGNRPCAGQGCAHRAPGSAREDGQAHAVEVAEHRRLGRVEVRVRVEPDDSRCRLGEAGHHTDRCEAAARQDDREGAVLARGPDPLLYLPHQIEACVDLAREAPLELHRLRLDRATGRARRLGGARLEQPFRPRPTPSRSRPSS